MAFAAFVISSCGNDDPKINSRLVGKWKFKDTEVQITVPGNNLFEYLKTMGMDSTEAREYATSLEAGDASEIDVATIDLRDDGSYESKANDGSVTKGNWKVSSDEKNLYYRRGYR